MCIRRASDGISILATNSTDHVTFDELTAVLAEFLVPSGLRPVVVYCGLFAIGRALPGPVEQQPEAVLDCILRAVGPRRTLLMPTYTPGPRDGRIDLDTEPCISGMVNERLRRLPGTRRTASAFFSFAARGPEADQIAQLRPDDAWGEGSLFAWIQELNAQLVVLGVPWAMSSFLHRAEWLTNVPYRYRKSFTSVCMRDGREEFLAERLFVRSLNPPAMNVWPGLDQLFEPRGLQRRVVGRSHVATISAEGLLGAVVPALQRDPYCFVQNAGLLRATFGAAGERQAGS